MVSMPSYWPQPAPGQMISVTFDDSEFIQYSNYAPVGFREDDYLNFRWLDAWMYRIDPVRGMLEFADEVPGDGPLYRQTKLLRDGKEIIWGADLAIGEHVGAQCVQQSPSVVYGWQTLKLLDILDDYKVPAGTFDKVARLHFWQYWGNGQVPNAEAIYYLAPKIGRICVEFFHVNYQPSSAVIRAMRVEGR